MEKPSLTPDQFCLAIGLAIEGLELLDPAKTKTRIDDIALRVMKLAQAKFCNQVAAPQDPTPEELQDSDALAANWSDLLARQ